MRLKLYTTLIILLCITSTSQANDYLNYTCHYPPGVNLQDWTTSFSVDDNVSADIAIYTCVHSNGHGDFEGVHGGIFGDLYEIFERIYL